MHTAMKEYREELPELEFGYRLLAEALMREKRLDDAFTAIKIMGESANRTTLLQEIRNNAVKTGHLDLYQEVSRMLGTDTTNAEDLATMLLVNLEKQTVEEMERIFNLLPENETKVNLTTTAIIELAYRGSMIGCERIAKVCNISLSKDQAMIAYANALRNGWISDAERAAKLLGKELTIDDYRVLFIANKDKGLLYEAQIAAERSGDNISKESLVALLLAGVKYNRKSIWKVAEML